MRQTRQKGFIEAIVIIIIAIATLSYFGINLRGFFDSPLVRENFKYVFDFATWLWHGYLRTPVLLFWKFFWSLVRPGLEQLQQGNITAP
jgi:hypothetical protein